MEMDNRSFYIATYLLDEIGNTLGLTEYIKQYFHDTYKQIQSVTYFMILESEPSRFRFEKWSTLHKHTYDKTISSKRSSELFSDISEEKRAKYFTLQEK